MPPCPAWLPAAVPLAGTNAWRQRRRMAGALLLFGCMAGVLCTHALVVSIQEEHEVVQLAQASWKRSSLAACSCRRGLATAVRASWMVPLGGLLLRSRASRPGASPVPVPPPASCRAGAGARGDQGGRGGTHGGQGQAGC